VKKILLVIALTFAAPAFAEPAMLPSHAVSSLALGINPVIQIELLAVSATTSTQAGVVTGGVGTAVILASNSGTESAPSTNTQGLYLKGIKAVSVFLKTASAATAGGTLQAYLMNNLTGEWYRAADLDLTATATTVQTWPAIYVPVSSGRLYYNPVGIGGGATVTVYIVGEKG
jgi:hypothetical protein